MTYGEKKCELVESQINVETNKIKGIKNGRN